MKYKFTQQQNKKIFEQKKIRKNKVIDTFRKKAFSDSFKKNIKLSFFTLITFHK